MRFNEFANTSDAKYYTVGDSHAKAIANSIGWPTKAVDGIKSSDPSIKTAIDSIPTGSVVVISLGQNDATATSDSPDQIASRINSLVKYSQEKGQTPVLTLFPPGTGPSAERNNQVRTAIRTGIKSHMLDLSNGQLAQDGIHLVPGAYSTAATTISSRIKPEIKNATSYSSNTGTLHFGAGVDTRINPSLLDKVKKTFSAFGKELTITSGYRSSERNKKVGGAERSQHLSGNAVDIDVSNVSVPDRIKLISIASANGITGIGVYKNSLHFDLGPRRYWGASYHASSAPDWSTNVLAAHQSGRFNTTIA